MAHTRQTSATMCQISSILMQHLLPYITINALSTARIVLVKQSDPEIIIPQYTTCLFCHYQRFQPMIETSYSAHNSPLSAHIT